MSKFFCNGADSECNCPILCADCTAADWSGGTEIKTNAERIRAMSDDELNELFHEIYNAGAEDAVSYVWGNRTNNFEWTMEWLQQTAGEEDKHEPTG